MLCLPAAVTPRRGAALLGVGDHPGSATSGLRGGSPAPSMKPPDATPAVQPSGGIVTSREPESSMTRPPGPRSPAGASRGPPPAGIGTGGEPGHLLPEPPDVVEVATGSVPDTGRRMRCCAGRGARFVPRGPEQWRRGRGAKRRAHFAQRPGRLPRLRQGCEPANAAHARQQTDRMSSPNSAISALGRGRRHVPSGPVTVAALGGWWHPVGPRTTGMLSP